MSCRSVRTASRVTASATTLTTHTVTHPHLTGWAFYSLSR
jgi:hypothetical protein